MYVEMGDDVLVDEAQAGASEPWRAVAMAYWAGEASTASTRTGAWRTARWAA